MTLPVLPVLGQAGWLTDPNQILSQLLAQAIVANYSQSNIYYGKITSIPYIIFSYQNEPDRLVIELRDRITKYLNKYLTQVTVQVDYLQTPTDLSSYDIFLSANGYYNGTFTDLQLTVSTDNGVIKNILQLTQVGG